MIPLPTHTTCFELHNNVWVLQVLQINVWILQVLQIYQWRVLPQVSFLPRQTFCHDKHVQNTSFVKRKVCLPRQITLSWQKFCRDKNILSLQADFCRNKTHKTDTCGSSHQWYKSMANITMAEAGGRPLDRSVTKKRPLYLHILLVLNCTTTCEYYKYCKSIIGGSCHKYLFAATNMCLSRQTHVCRDKTRLLSWEKYR